MTRRPERIPFHDVEVSSTRYELAIGGVNVLSHPSCARRSPSRAKRAIAPVVALAVFALLVSGCGLSQYERGFLQYLDANHSAIESFADDGDYSALAPLRNLAETSNVVFYGESHGIADNYSIVLKLMKYLHSLGYRYLVLEEDFTDADRYNQYLATGDEGLLTGLDKWKRTKFETNSVEGLQFFRELRNWNQSLPEDERIAIWSADVSMQYEQAKQRISEQISRIPRPRVVPRLLELFLSKSDSYSGVKSFEGDLERELSGLSGREIEELRLQVRSLKDAYASDASRQDENVAADYPSRADIRDLAMAAAFDGYWRWADAPRTGKVFVYMGARHGDVTQNTVGRILSEKYEPTKGKVATIAGIPLSGQYRENDGTVQDASPGQMGISPALARALMKLGRPYLLALAPSGSGLPYSAYILIRSAIPVHDR